MGALWPHRLENLVLGVVQEALEILRKDGVVITHNSANSGLDVRNCFAHLEERVLVLVYETVDVVGDVPGVVEDDKVAAELESLWTLTVYHLITHQSSIIRASDKAQKHLDQTLMLCFNYDI